MSRRFHPHQAKAYTVWNMKTAARARNHGSRVDYVLAGSGQDADEPVEVGSHTIGGPSRAPEALRRHAGCTLYILNSVGWAGRAKAGI